MQAIADKQQVKYQKSGMQSWSRRGFGRALRPEKRRQLLPRFFARQQFAERLVGCLIKL
jgi:hypothetical protein